MNVFSLSRQCRFGRLLSNEELSSAGAQMVAQPDVSYTIEVSLLLSVFVIVFLVLYQGEPKPQVASDCCYKLVKSLTILILNRKLCVKFSISHFMCKQLSSNTAMFWSEGLH